MNSLALAAIILGGGIILSRLAKPTKVGKDVMSKPEVPKSPPRDKYPPGSKLPTGEYVPTDIPEVSGSRWTKEDARVAVGDVAKLLGTEIARAVDKTWNIESGGYKSGEYRATGGAGLHPFKPAFPYRGENSILGKIWKQHPELKPTGYYWGIEGRTKKWRVYLAFPHPKAFAGTFALYIAEIMRQKNCSADEAAATWLGTWGSDLWRKRLAALKSKRSEFV